MKILALFEIFSLIVASLLLPFSQGWTQPRPGTNAPVITHSYAIEKGRYGDVFKIYIEADDPNGEMLRIATVAHQLGHGHYPPDWVFLKPENEHHFVGYLQWNTYSGYTSWVSEWTQLTLEVSVFDKAGHESNAVVFPIEFASEVINNPPPPTPFNQGDIPRLGHVFINIMDTGGREK